MIKNKASPRRDKVMKEKIKYVRFKYTEEELINAVNSIRNKEKTLNQVHNETGILKSTLSTKVNNKVPIFRKMGPNTILSEAEESKIVKWILAKAKVGFPVHPENIKDSIQKILQSSPRKNPFNDNRPGKKWLISFLKRHQEIAMKNTEIISKARAAVTENSIRYWFDGVSSFLKENNSLDLLSDGRRIINCDETGIQLCPKSGKVLGPKNIKNFYEISKSSEKENITVLCTYSADGSILPPMIIYPYKRIPCHIYQSVPDTWGIGRSDSGWMVSATFFEYIANIMYPWLVNNNVEFPVILYLDGHKSHLSLELSEFCSEKKIILYCLPPNATHILQPCDVSIFKPLKSYWKDVIKTHNLTSQSPITKNNFGNIFKKAFDKVKPESIINGFKTCGIFPFNPDIVDYSKCIPNRQAEVNSMIQDQEQLECPSKNDYIACMKVLKYTLKNQTIENILNSEPMLKKVWNTCYEEITDNTNKCSFNILDMPIELEGSNFNFDENVLADLGVRVLNSGSTYDEEEKLHNFDSDDDIYTLNTNSRINQETIQYLNEEGEDSNDERRVQYSDEENYNIVSQIEELEMQLLDEEVDQICLQKTQEVQEVVQYLDKHNDKIRTQIGQKNQNFNEENEKICLMEEVQEVIQYLDEGNNKTCSQEEVQEIKNLDKNDELTQVTEKKAQYSDKENSKTVQKLNEHETQDLGKENSSKASNLSIEDLWKQHFSWPKEEIKGNKNPKFKIPYAITSDKWKNIQIEKEKRKLEKENLILEKRNARILKKVNAEKKRKNEKVLPKGNTKKQKSENSLDTRILTITEENTTKKSTDNYSVGDFVMVQYEGEYFPGIIKEKKNQEFKVSSKIYS